MEVNEGEEIMVDEIATTIEDVIFQLSTFRNKLQGIDAETEIAGTRRDTLEGVIEDAEWLLKGLSRDRDAKQKQINDLTSSLKDKRPIRPIIIGKKLYCGNCKKRIPIKKKPRYCMKCGCQINKEKDVWEDM